MGEQRSWDEMRGWMLELLMRSGHGVDEWNRRLDEAGATDEKSTRAFLDAHGVHGYAQTLMVFERYGYPDFFTASADELIAAQYADRPALRPIYDRIALIALSLGEGHLQARKGYVSLVGPRRTYARVRASTRKRVDLILRSDADWGDDRFIPAGGAVDWPGAVKAGLNEVSDVDHAIEDALRRTYEENL